MKLFDWGETTFDVPQHQGIKAWHGIVGAFAFIGAINFACAVLDALKIIIG